MAFFLRDQYIQNIIIDSEALTQINNVFIERYGQLKTELSKNTKDAFLTYVIRFDNKGYRVFNLDELLMYFNQAHKIERVIFTVEADDAITSKRATGAYLELCLDAQDPTRCTLISSSNTKDWAEASFAAVHEVISKYKTKNGMARSPWTNLAFQLFGVVISFIVSLWLAFKIAPNLKVDNAFLLSFLFILLVFSNIWGYLNQALLGFIAKLFPNIEFLRPAKDRLNWILQAIIGSATFAIVVYFLGSSLSFLSKFLAGFFNP